ncbi:protein ENHANCED DISEASE RESISTANCE 2-like isoform X2 [Coffea arabica]|uniref:Protein ENHANCED DISEASE RESISTANCE 2-like isoform X2 n=1 Tax=Coffea arabica TaxID=13443 RepID=A0ABM4UU97_COFAR
MASWGGALKKVASEGGGGSESGGSESGADDSSGNSSNTFEYFGWVYHLGVNSIGHEYCHLRYLCIRGKYVEMYKRDPRENPGVKPIRRGVVGHTLMVEELGRRKVNSGDLYVLRFYNRLDETRKGEIACANAGEARKWMEAFDHAKQQAEYELSRGASTRSKLNVENEINLEGHRPRVRRYAHGLKKLIRIGQGPEMLLRQSSSLEGRGRADAFFDAHGGDAVEAHEWKCVRTINGVRIFEDVASSESGKGVVVKAVGVVDASADTVFDVVLSLDRHQRYEWDTLTGDLELVNYENGHYDVVYGVFDPNYLTWWRSKRDFVFSRQWFRGQDGTYTILQFPAVHKNRPPKSGYRRTKINRLKEYVGANPALTAESPTTVIHSKISDVLESNGELEVAEAPDEFYDAIAGDSSSEDDNSDDDSEKVNKNRRIKLKNVSWAIASLALQRMSAPDANKELNPDVTPINLDAFQFHGSMQRGGDETDTNCWTSPSGTGFMIRGKSYLKDSIKVKGGEPLLKLIAVDWFNVDNRVDNIALHPKCLVQSEAGKKVPFILVINLQVPAKPNYSMVLYYAADRPVNKNSLLGKFVEGTDMFRDSRFKLIPSIVEGYWMVKRAVGTKACLLGKAVTCKYLRQDNFLEIDVDIGSSSVARSVIGLVLGYVTSIVVDLAILIEAKEEAELPEYILGTVRLNRVRLDSAVRLEN